MIINVFAILSGLVATVALFMLNRDAPMSSVNLVTGVAFALAVPAIIRAFHNFFRAFR
ncbi:MAG TPA: hypothetical protein VK485_01300 [Sphingomicrobium sp.]|nr:hypothetical protein [Sphingomicrobium sp.]